MVPFQCRQTAPGGYTHSKLANIKFTKVVYVLRPGLEIIYSKKNAKRNHKAIYLNTNLGLYLTLLSELFLHYSFKDFSNTYSSLKDSRTIVNTQKTKFKKKKTKHL